MGTAKSKYYLFFWKQVANASCSSGFSLFLGEKRILNSGNHPRSDIPNGKKVPLPVQFLLIYIRGWNLSCFFSAVMMILSVIITYSFYNGFLLLCCHFPGVSHLTSDFELIDDVTVVETSCLSSFEPRSLFTLLGCLVYLLSVLVPGWETFARSYKRSLPNA